MPMSPEKNPLEIYKILPTDKLRAMLSSQLPRLFRSGRQW